VSGRLVAFVLALLAVGVLVAVVGGGGGGSDDTRAAALAPGQTEPIPVPLPEAGITGVDAPSIGVATEDTTDLSLQSDNTLEVPRRAATVGWYDESASPGEVGPAVLAAHVNLDGDEGAFYRLGRMPAGATVEVHRDDDTTAVFVIDRVERYAKYTFPTEAVYGPTPDSQLRLITCGGVFDHGAGSYEENIVAFGHLTGAYRSG
jgi:hypothetical protein